MNHKQRRLKNFNYSNAGAYFITICTSNRQNILGNFIANKSIRPFFILSNYGKIVDKNINKISSYYDNVYIDNYIVMPNHIHLLILSNNKIYIPNIIKSFKSFTSKEIGKNIFQRSFYDHIIRNRDEYMKIWQYITDNPINWNKDIYFS